MCKSHFENNQATGNGGASVFDGAEKMNTICRTRLIENPKGNKYGGRFMHVS
jgi:hypothetical protein